MKATPPQQKLAPDEFLQRLRYDVSNAFNDFYRQLDYDFDIKEKDAALRFKISWPTARTTPVLITDPASGDTLEFTLNPYWAPPIGQTTHDSYNIQMTDDTSMARIYVKRFDDFTEMVNAYKNAGVINEFAEAINTYLNIQF